MLILGTELVNVHIVAENHERSLELQERIFSSTVQITDDADHANSCRMRFNAMHVQEAADQRVAYRLANRRPPARPCDATRTTQPPTLFSIAMESCIKNRYMRSRLASGNAALQLYAYAVLLCSFYIHYNNYILSIDPTHVVTYLCI
jgi:hypothetical protein